MLGDHEGVTTLLFKGRKGGSDIQCDDNLTVLIDGRDDSKRASMMEPMSRCLDEEFKRETRVS